MYNLIVIDTIDPQPLLATPVRLDQCQCKSQSRLVFLLFHRMVVCNFFLLFVWTVSSHELCADGGLAGRTGGIVLLERMV